MDFSPVGRVCSFCGRVGTAETHFAGGLGALMCEDCLNKYHELFSNEESKQAIRRPPWEQMSDAEMLAQLPLISATAHQVTEFMADWVGLIRERKISWTEIGKVLGISRQAAWERFTRAMGTARHVASTG